MIKRTKPKTSRKKRVSSRSKSSSLEKQKKSASLRKKIKSYFGNECFICGYNKCLKALETHHIDASTKSFNISMNVTRYKWETVVKECLKCVLLCNRCHAEVEEGITDITTKDIPKSYYKAFIYSLKPAKHRFKSKSYEQRKRSSTNRSTNKTTRRTRKRK